MLRTVPDSVKTDGMRSAEADAKASGYTIRWFSGDNKTAGGIERAAVDPDTRQMWICADDSANSAEQLYQHERYHSLPESVRAQTAARLRTDRGAELDDLIGAYVDAYDGWDGKDNEFVTEEILADAYAGIDIYAGISDYYEGATRFSEETRAAVESAETEASTERGPPVAGTKYSRQAPRKVATFLRDYSGRVLEDKGIALEGWEKDAIGSAIKSGKAQLNKDAKSGYAPINKKCYILETIGDDVIVTDIATNEELNIHNAEFEEEYENGRETANQKSCAGAENKGRGQGFGRDNLAPSQERWQTRPADAVDEGQSESNTQRDNGESKAVAQRKVTEAYSPDNATERWTSKELAERSAYISKQLKDNKRLSDTKKTELRREQRIIIAELQKRYDDYQAGIKGTKHSTKITKQQDADYAAVEREVPSFAPREDSPPSQYAAEGQQTGDPPAEVKYSEKAEGKETEQNAYIIGGEYDEWKEDIPRRSETKQEFRARSAERHATTYSVGETTYAYRRVGLHDSSYQAERASREAKRLGIKNFLFRDMEVNSGGYTEPRHSSGITIGRSIVGFNADMSGNGIETAGHEAFHFWAGNGGTEFADYAVLLVDSIKYDSSLYNSIKKSVELAYRKNGLSSQQLKGLFLEEVLAEISGRLHAAEAEDYVLQSMFTDYSAVKAAWDNLVDYEIAKRNTGGKQEYSTKLTDKQRPADYAAVERRDMDAGRLISHPPSLYDLAYAMYSGDADRLYRQLSTRQAVPGGWPEPEPEPIPDPEPEREPDPAPEPGVDYLSILDLGYGPLSAAQLRDLIEMGKVERVIEDGRVRFRRASRTPGT